MIHEIPSYVQSFEALNPRAVAVVVDPIQSVRGKVVIDAFRLINAQTLMLGQEPRQTTSNIGHLQKPSIQVSHISTRVIWFSSISIVFSSFQAIIHGLNRHYYSIAINYRKHELEQKMLLNVHRTHWSTGLNLPDFEIHDDQNRETMKVSAPHHE
jgi:26S proteasome regulatory subunit N11